MVYNMSFPPTGYQNCDFSSLAHGLLRVISSRIIPKRTALLLWVKKD